MLKRLFAFTAVTGALLLAADAVSASNLPYEAYTKTLRDEKVKIASPYRVYDTVKSIQGTKPLYDPQDMSAKDGRLYIADTGNNRVIALNEAFERTAELEGLSSPGGVFAADDFVYISDTNHSRILKTDMDLNIVKIFEKPDIPVLGGYSYLPQKIAVDYAGRIYVVAQGVNRGIIQLNRDGSFFGFLGAPKVSYDIFDLFIKSVSTDAQLDRMPKFVPTEYSGVNIDKKGFLFATSASSSVKAIAKLNFSGENVLKQPDGTKIEGEKLTDIALSGSGLYSVCDSATGIVYTYDADGYFLFEFGGSGDGGGLSRAALAIEYMGDRLLVLDSVGNKLTVYEKTDFCALLENAITCYGTGKYDEAYNGFNEVLKLSSSFTYGQIGLAKIEIQRKNYGTAMSLLKAAGEKEYYSTAFKEYRKDLLRGNFFWGCLALAIAVLLIVLLLAAGKKKRIGKLTVKSKLGNELLYAKYIIFHPFDGFWDLKHEKRGSKKAALILFATALTEYACDRTLKGYLFMPLSKIDLAGELLIVVLTVLLWCAANWSLTTLMDGKGRFADIFNATAYALVPYIIFSPFLILVSHFITSEEAALFNAVQYIVYIWVAALLLVGMIMTHDYSLSKMLLTTTLTVFTMAVIMFFVLVFFNMLQMSYDFFFNIYKELSLRV